MRIRSPFARRVAAGVCITMTLLVTVVSPVSAKPRARAYFTDQDAFITLADGLPKGAKVTPIISSGEKLRGFRFQGIPDGIGVRKGNKKHTVDVYVAHEETTVPFFGSSDLQDASVSKLTLSTKGKHRGGVLHASTVVSPDEGFLRFCSASMADRTEGFDDPIFFTGEETDDDGLAVPEGALYGPDAYPGDGTRQGGYAVAFNTNTGELVTIASMGRLNHENTIALPGYKGITMLTTDDTFNRPSAQVYMYLADSQDDVFADKGTLWAFRVTAKNGKAVKPGDAFNGANDYNDVMPGDDLQGEFIPVPEEIARGLTDELPQDALENWSNDNNVFQFVRAEDIAYDKNNPRVVYMADTGGSQIQPDAETGRLARDRDAESSVSSGGAIFRFEFNAKNPKVVDSFTKMAQGDDPTKGAFVPFVSPDNLDTSTKSIMVQEDTDNAKIWQLRLRKGDWRPVAEVNDPDGESSGIVDVSEWFGPGHWLLDVQGHGTNVIERTESTPDGDVLRKLESGQLMLLKIPGS